MLNILIANKDIFFSKMLMNNINNTYSKVSKIATDGEEAIKFLDTNNIDVIILDLDLSKYDGYNILNILLNTKKERFINSIIVVASNINFSDELINNPLIYSCCKKEDSLTSISKKVNEMIRDKYKQMKITAIKNKIIKEMNYLGYNPTYNGTYYLIECILLIAESKDDLISNLEKNVYPYVAKKHNKTISNIKCNINQSTTCMYYECESTKLQHYFNLDDDLKPKPKLVMSTILNKVL